VSEQDDRSAASRDDAIAKSESPQAEKGSTSAAAAARLFDIRRIIGGLFVLYGLVLFVAGLLDGADAKKQAADIDINVWAGLAMLALGLFFLGWMWRRPLVAPEEDGEAGTPDNVAEH
jgi:hypothetical protein